MALFNKKYNYSQAHLVLEILWQNNLNTFTISFLSSVSNYEYSNMSYQVISKLLCLLWDAWQKGDSEDAKLHSILVWHSLTISFKLSRLYLIPGIQQNQHRIIINSFIKTHHLRI